MQSFRRWHWGAIIATLIALVVGGTLIGPAMGPGVSSHVAIAARSASQLSSSLADTTSTITPTATVAPATVTSTPTATSVPAATNTSTSTPVAPTSTSTAIPAATATKTPVPAATSTAAAAPTATSVPSGPALPAGVYHFVGSLVASAGAQVSHVEGILTLQVGANGALTASALHLTTGATVSVSGMASQGSLAFTANGMPLTGISTAVGRNRVSGLFAGPTGGTLGFWVATRIATGQNGTMYAFSGHIGSGPDRDMTYSGRIELWGDTYGALVGWLRLSDGTVLNVSGQSVNGNVNMLIVVRTGTPMFVSGTTIVNGNLRGTIAGPLAGDEGTWTATK